MDFNLEVSLEGDVHVVTFRGQCTSKNARAITACYFETILGQGCKKVLADIRSLEGRLPLADTYFLMRDLPVDRVPRDIRTAILENRDNHDYAYFLETTAENAGIRFKCFFDRREALFWLHRE